LPKPDMESRWSPRNCRRTIAICAL